MSAAAPADPPAVHLAQINLGTLLASTDDPLVAEFMANLDPVNAVADTAPGFVWRLQDDDGNATSIQVSPDPRCIVNLSVWTSLEALEAFVFRTDHVGFLRRRREWFEPGASRTALWWIPAGTTPDLGDALRRVAFLDRHGPSPYAFRLGRPETPLLLEETTLDDPDTLALVARLNAELTALADDPSENHFGLATDEITGPNGRMVLARLDGRPVGCGAVRRIEPTVGELKRMYVDDAARGRKVGAAVLDRLEQLALGLGMTEVKLETSPRQPAAIGLYEGAGYVPCEPWGEYVRTAATSACYRKPLTP